MSDSARTAYARGDASFRAALIERQHALNAVSLGVARRDQIGGAALVHGVAERETGGFSAGVAYADWEEWAEISPPLPLPEALIIGYEAEEDLHTQEFVVDVAERSRECAQVVTLSRVLERRLLLLAAPGDETQPDRVRAAITAISEVTSELEARYGIATGLAVQLLNQLREAQAPRSAWFRPIPVEVALAEWAVSPFWVDRVKVARVTEAWEPVLGEAPAEELYAFRTGDERDHTLTMFSVAGDRIEIAASLRNTVKRFSGRHIEHLDAPPEPHIWAATQLGFSELQVGDAECGLRHMMPPEELRAIYEETVGIARGTIRPRQ